MRTGARGGASEPERALQGDRRAAAVAVLLAGFRAEEPAKFEGCKRKVSALPSSDVRVGADATVNL